MLIGNPMVYRQLPLEMALEKTIAPGYDGLELWPPQIIECRTPALRRQLASYLTSRGAPPIRLNCADREYFQSLESESDVEKAWRGLQRDIDMAAELGMQQLLTWEGRRSPQHTEEDIGGWVLTETANLFRRACAYGREKGVSLSVEVHPFTLGIDVDWLIQLCTRVDDGSFGITYDCCHFAVGLPDAYVAAIRSLGPWIRHVHFCDSDKHSSELHFAPGTGCLDLDGIVDTLRETGFAGTVMLDLWLYPLPDYGTSIGVPYMRNVLKRLGLENDIS